jgi:hypothetical protein
VSEFKWNYVWAQPGDMFCGLARFLDGVDVLIALAFGKNRIIDGSADAKGKLQPAFY